MASRTQNWTLRDAGSSAYVLLDQEHPAALDNVFGQIQPGADVQVW